MTDFPKFAYRVSHRDPQLELKAAMSTQTHSVAPIPGNTRKQKVVEVFSFSAYGFAETEPELRKGIIPQEHYCTNWDAYAKAVEELPEDATREMWETNVPEWTYELRDTPPIMTLIAHGVGFWSSCPVTPDVTIKGDIREDSLTTYSFVLIAALTLLNEKNDSDRILIEGPRWYSTETVQVWPAKEETND